MEAMILAAGAGTRLRPLTDTLPKALVDVGGKTLLERVLARIRETGATRVIVNTHHHQEQIEDFLAGYPTGGMEIVLSPEPGGPYDTGGGLFAAASLFREETPFLLHNVDILSEIPLAEMVERHAEGKTREGLGGAPVASLAVQERAAERRLLFDDLGLLGWENRGSDRSPEGKRTVREAVGVVRSLSFTGIHVIDPRIFGLSGRRGTFSIIDLYLELAGAGHRIRPLDVTGYRWLDVGTPRRLVEAEEWDGRGNGAGGAPEPARERRGNAQGTVGER